MSRRIVEAEAFLLRDARGNMRAALECTEEGPAIGLVDAQGTVRAAMRIVKDMPLICLYDRDAKPRMELSLKNQHPQLSLHGEYHPGTITLELGEEGSYLSIGSPTAGTAIHLSAEPTGVTLEFFRSFLGGRRAARFTTTDTGSALTLNGKTGGPRIQLSVKGQKPALAFLDKDGDRLISLTVSGKRPTLRVQRGKGTPALVIPLEELKKT
jgi:hypothetical protein